MQKIEHLLRKIKNLRWTNTSCPVDILIVDMGSIYIKHCLPTDVTYRTVPIRGEIWYLNSAIAVNFLSALIQRKKYNMGLRGCYVAALAKSLRVKIVLTYIDNNNWDIGLSNYLNRRVVCIQNATRPRWYLNKLNKCFDHYLVYSPVLADPTHGLKIFSREAQTVGHLKLGIFFEGMANGTFSQLDLRYKSIVWISTYREKENYADEIKSKYEENIRLMQIGVNYMARYAAKNGYEARVALASHYRSKSPSKEIATLSEKTSYELTFSPYSSREYDYMSYKEVWASELVVGINSTLLYESAALGKRTILFLPDEDRKKALEQVAPLSIMQPIIVQDSSYKAFSNKCDQILGMSAEEYDEIVNEIRSKVCFFDPTNLPQERIKNKLRKIAKGRLSLSKRTVSSGVNIS